MHFQFSVVPLLSVLKMYRQYHICLFVWVSLSLFLSISLSQRESSCLIVLITQSRDPSVLPLENTENTDCEGLSSSSSIPPRGFPLLEEGVLVVDGSRSPSFPLLALHPFQLEERRLPLAFLALFCPAARSASSGGFRFAPSFLRRGRGRRASGRQRGRRRLRRTTGSAGQV